MPSDLSLLLSWDLRPLVVYLDFFLFLLGLVRLLLTLVSHSASVLLSSGATLLPLSTDKPAASSAARTIGAASSTRSVNAPAADRSASSTALY